MKHFHGDGILDDTSGHVGMNRLGSWNTPKIESNYCNRTLKLKTTRNGVRRSTIATAPSIILVCQVGSSESRAVPCRAMARDRLEETRKAYGANTIRYPLPQQGASNSATTRSVDTIALLSILRQSIQTPALNLNINIIAEWRLLP